MSRYAVVVGFVVAILIPRYPFRYNRRRYAARKSFLFRTRFLRRRGEAWCYPDSLHFAAKLGQENGGFTARARVARFHLR